MKKTFGSCFLLLCAAIFGQAANAAVLYDGSSMPSYSRFSGLAGFARSFIPNSTTAVVNKISFYSLEYISDPTVQICPDQSNAPASSGCVTFTLDNITAGVTEPVYVGSFTPSSVAKYWVTVLPASGESLTTYIAGNIAGGSTKVGATFGTAYGGTDNGAGIKMKIEDGLLTPTLTWSPTLSITAVSSPLTFAAATSTSSGAISYSVVAANSTGCTIANAASPVLTFTGAGNNTAQSTCSVMATTEATATHGRATSTQNFVISKVARPVTWNVNTTVPLLQTPISLAVPTSSIASPAITQLTVFTGNNPDTAGCSLTPSGSWFELSASTVGTCDLRVYAAAPSVAADAAKYTYNALVTTFSIVGPAISPATQSLSVQAGTATTAYLTANYLAGAVTFSVSPSLPTGLTLNTSTGTISGTPTTAQSVATYTVTATGATSGTVIPNSATATVDITVTAPAAVTPATQTLSGRVGTAITNTSTLTAANFSGAVSFSVSPALPAGLSLNSSTGVISGTPTATQSATTHTITGTGATSGSATATVSVTVVNPVPAATGTPMGAPGDGKVTVSWAQAASTTPRPVQYTVTASPGGQTCTANFPGWAFATASCDVTGLTNGTAYTFVVKSSNAMGDTDSSPSTSVTPLSVLNGACGASDGVATLIPPTGLLCSAGVAGIVSSSRGGYSWSCSGTNGGTTSQCFADGDTAPSAQPQAKTTFVSDNVVSGCTTQSARGVTPPSSGPSGIVMPYGAVDFQLVDCTATQATAVLTYSRVVEGMQFWKYVNNSHHQSPRWVQLSPSEVTLRGNTATYVIVDNGPFDNDPALGAISDPGGPGYSPSSLAAPDTPLNVQVAVGDSQAVISWTAASTGSAAITYVVTASPGGLSCTATAPATSCTIPGLTNGTAYTFSVVASNGVGDSSATAASAPATPSAPVAIPSLGEWAMALMGLLMLGFGILRMRRGNGLTQQ